MVVFVATLLTVAVDVVVFEEGIVVGQIVGRRVQVRLRVSVRIGGTADLGYVGQLRIGR